MVLSLKQSVIKSVKFLLTSDHDDITIIQSHVTTFQSCFTLLQSYVAINNVLLAFNTLCFAVSNIQLTSQEKQLNGTILKLVRRKDQLDSNN